MKNRTQAADEEEAEWTVWRSPMCYQHVYLQKVFIFAVLGDEPRMPGFWASALPQSYIATITYNVLTKYFHQEEAGTERIGDFAKDRQTCHGR